MTTALTMFAEERSGRKEREREWVGECWQDGRTDSPLSPPSAPIARPGAAPGHRRWPGGRRPRLFGLPADRPNRRRPSEKRGSARPSPPRSPPPTSPLSPVLLRPGPASRICPPPHLPPHFGLVGADAMKGCVAEGPGTEDTRSRGRSTTQGDMARQRTASRATRRARRELETQDGRRRCYPLESNPQRRSDR